MPERLPFVSAPALHVIIESRRGSGAWSGECVRVVEVLTGQLFPQAVGAAL